MNDRKIIKISVQDAAKQFGITESAIHRHGVTEARRKAGQKIEADDPYYIAYFNNGTIHHIMADPELNRKDRTGYEPIEEVEYELETLIKKTQETAQQIRKHEEIEDRVHHTGDTPATCDSRLRIWELEVKAMILEQLIPLVKTIPYDQREGQKLAIYLERAERSHELCSMLSIMQDELKEDKSLSTAWLRRLESFNLSK